MRRFIFLVLCLGSISIANAGVIDLMITSLNEHQIDPVKEIVISPSDTIGMEIFYREGGGYEALWRISFDIIVTGTGSLDMTQAYTGYDFHVPWELLTTEEPFQVSSDAIFGDVGGNTLLVGGMFAHCDAPGDVVISMINNPALPAGGTTEFNQNNQHVPDFSGVIIHQIPEPLTLAILGLGGLLLRRRR